MRTLQHDSLLFLAAGPVQAALLLLDPGYEACTALALAEESALTVAATSLSRASTCRSSRGCCRTCASWPPSAQYTPQLFASTPPSRRPQVQRLHFSCTAGHAFSGTVLLALAWQSAHFMSRMCWPSNLDLYSVRAPDYAQQDSQSSALELKGRLIVSQQRGLQDRRHLAVVLIRSINVVARRFGVHVLIQ